MTAKIHYYSTRGINYDKDQVIYKSFCGKLKTEPMNRDLISIYILEKQGLSVDFEKITCSACRKHFKVLFPEITKSNG